MFKQIKSMIEKKHIDKTINGVFGNDNIVANLHLIAEGVTSATRTGLKITARTLYIRLALQWASTATQEGTVRFIVFMDRYSTGALPTGGNLLEAVTTYSQYNNINEGRRFVVLKDVLYNNKNATTAVSKFEGHTLKIPINKNIWYLDGSATATALGRNSLYYLLVGDVAIADPDACAVTGTTRLYYEDI